MTRHLGTVGVAVQPRYRGGVEIVEVGPDVFLVEVATSIIHDVLIDVIW